jgi:hypothetical protein
MGTTELSVTIAGIIDPPTEGFSSLFRTCTEELVRRDGMQMR